MCNLPMAECTCIKFNAYVIQLCVCCYHTKSGFSESIVVDERSISISSTAGCTTNWCPDSSLSKIGLADDACGCGCGCECVCVCEKMANILQMLMITKGFCNGSAVSVSPVG